MVSERIFTWLILASAFLGLYTIFLNINIYIKIIAVYLFCACFFSSAIYYSFSAYISFIACLYYYILLLRIADWNFTKRSLLIILLLNGILLFMQFIGCDTLLNFGLKNNQCSGAVGNFMNLKSLLIIITAFLISFLRIDMDKLKKWLPSIIVLLVIAGSIYMADHKICFYFPMVRGAVWVKTIVLACYNGVTTLFGWGMSTFSITFPQLTQNVVNPEGYAPGSTTAWIREGTWLQCHNDFLQILFETGFIGFTLILLYTVDLFHRLKELKLYSLVIGLSLICADMMVHFPTRQTSTLLIIIVFLAYCEFRIKKENLCQR
jgi:hypothetical protein